MLLKTGKGEEDLLVLAIAGKGKAAETCLPSPGGGGGWFLLVRVFLCDFVFRPSSGKATLR